MRRIATSDSAGLAKSIGPQAAALAELVKDTPPDSEQLLLQMLTVLTGKACPCSPFSLLFFMCVQLCVGVSQMAKRWPSRWPALTQLILPTANVATAVHPENGV